MGGPLPTHGGEHSKVVKLTSDTGLLAAATSRPRLANAAPTVVYPGFEGGADEGRTLAEWAAPLGEPCHRTAGTVGRFDRPDHSTRTRNAYF